MHKMSKNEKCHNDNAEIENITTSIIKESSMKYGWHQIINNIVCCYKMPHGIVLILEQTSNYMNLLRDQMNVEKVTHIRQHTMISDENTFVSTLCAIANEHVPNDLDRTIKIMILK